jgi:hypothetical protein
VARPVVGIGMERAHLQQPGYLLPAAGLDQLAGEIGCAAGAVAPGS